MLLAESQSVWRLTHTTHQAAAYRKKYFANPPDPDEKPFTLYVCVSAVLIS